MQGIILGDVFMQNYHVLFDCNNKRIGFGDICPNPDQAVSRGVLFPYFCAVVVLAAISVEIWKRIVIRPLERATS